MKEALYQTAQGLASILGYGTVSRVEAGEMDGDERGWSGAEVVRRKVFFADGACACV